MQRRMQRVLVWLRTACTALACGCFVMDYGLYMQSVRMDKAQSCARAGSFLLLFSTLAHQDAGLRWTVRTVLS